MIYDCHLHTEFSGDSQTPVRAQIEKAIGLGMEEMCITDHHDYDAGFCEVDFNLDIPSYLTFLKAVRDEYKNRIHINIGIELGIQNHLEEYLTRFEEQYGREFDFIIGSNHFVDKIDPYYPDYWEQYGERGGLERFFSVSLERTRRLNHVFDSLGHLDYVVRYAPHPDDAYSYEKFAFLIDPLLKVLIENGKALECNTGSFKYGRPEPNPCSAILKRYRQLGGELITIGSDAHTPEYVGNHFEQCRQLLLDCGFRYYAVYRRRKARMIRL